MTIAQTIPTKRRGAPDSVKQMQVIEVTTVKGIGTNDDPVRQLVQYWSLDGELLAERDSLERKT